MAPANHVETLALFMKAVCGPQMWDRDHSIVPLPFDEAEYRNDQKLKVSAQGVFQDSLQE